MSIDLVAKMDLVHWNGKVKIGILKEHIKGLLLKKSI